MVQLHYVGCHDFILDSRTLFSIMEYLLDCIPGRRTSVRYYSDNFRREKRELKKGFVGKFNFLFMYILDMGIT